MARHPMGQHMRERSLLLLALLLPAGAAAARSGSYSAGRLHTGVRIINGTVVANASSNYPFFALPTQSEDSDAWLGCGASVISPSYGLSAAHCFGGGNSPCSLSKNVAVWVGDVVLADGAVVPRAGGKSARIRAERICHPEFDGKCSHGHDIVLLKFLDPLPSWVTPVAVDVDGLASVGDPMTTIGYGYTESDMDPEIIDGVSRDLRKVGLILLGQKAAGCRRMYSGGWGCSDAASEAPAQNEDQQLCLGSPAGLFHDSCSGDSGSPLLNAAGVQVGIVSYGGGPGDKVSGPGRICGDPAYPGVYSRVSAFADFIKRHVGDTTIV